LIQWLLGSVLLGLVLATATFALTATLLRLLADPDDAPSTTGVASQAGNAA
jgi:hypothetical protein